MCKTKKIIALSMTLMALFDITSGCAYGMEDNANKRYTIFAVTGNESTNISAGTVCVNMKRKSKNEPFTLPDSGGYAALTKNRKYTIIGESQNSIKMDAHVSELCEGNSFWFPIAGGCKDLAFYDGVLKEKKIDNATITTIKNAWEEIGAAFKGVYNLEDLCQVSQKIEKDEEKSEKEKKLTIITKDLKKVAEDELLLEIGPSIKNDDGITVNSIHVTAGLSEAMGANKISIDGETYYTIAVGNPNLQNIKRTHVADLWEIKNQPDDFAVLEDLDEQIGNVGDLEENTLKKIVNFHKNPKKSTTSMGPVVGLVGGGIGILGAYALYKWLKK